MLRATLPRAFVIKPDGEMTVNSDYFTSVELTSTDPQIVTYTINPKAVWSDGSPITWEDMAAQINATSGKDKRFLFASPNGSERVASVTKGVDERQAVITFDRHFADWRGMFAGNAMLAPKAVTSDPEAFNKGFLNGPSVVRGPVHDQHRRPGCAANHPDPQPEMVGNPAAAGFHHLHRAR